jgi:bifunctional ADP-heptose synthase (sugar kinase/adenylyltransferase)
VAERAPWWALNAQTNSTNFGFNRVTRYRGADFVCIDELEARLPSGMRSQPLEEVVSGLQTDMDCESILVTRGADGMVLFGNGDTWRAPAVATSIVDPVGAGDAVLSITSLVRAVNADPALCVLLGTCAGAVAAGIVGNEEPVRRETLLARVADMLDRRPDGAS